jgi:hypothetical protein
MGDDEYDLHYLHALLCLNKVPICT